MEDLRHALRSVEKKTKKRILIPKDTFVTPGGVASFSRLRSRRLLS